MAAVSNTEFAKTLGMPPEWAAKAAAFADAKGLSLAGREVVAEYKESWTGRDGKVRPANVVLIVTADAAMALALKAGRNFAPVSTEWTADGREWVDVWLGATPPAACRVKFEVGGIDAPVVVTHTLAEYTQGKLSGVQLTMPASMLAKATIQMGLRRIAPQALAGLYVAEEIEAVDAAVEAEVEHVEKVVEAVTPEVDKESTGTKMTRAEQHAARMQELVVVGKALRADCGDEAAAVLAGAIKARGCDPHKLTAADLKVLLDVAKRQREDFERKDAEPESSVAPEAAAAMDAATEIREAAAASSEDHGVQALTDELQAEFII